MKTIFKILFIGIILGFGLKLFVIESFIVPTDSMSPTIAVGEKVWLCKLPFLIKKNNIVGFERNGEYFVKRIVGMPSETVCTDGTSRSHREGANFEMYQEKRLVSDKSMALIPIPKRGETVVLDAKNYALYQPLIEKEGASVGKLLDKIFINGSETTNYTFKQNYYFVQGDNTLGSIDSRKFGLVGEDCILGFVF
jgi:signal peptidase I